MMKQLHAGVMALVVGAAGAVLTVPASVAAPHSPAESGSSLQEIRRFATAEHGIGRPSGLAWSPQQGALLVAEPASVGTRVVSVTPDEERLRSTGIRDLADAATLAVDPSTGALRAVGLGVSRRALGLTSPTAMTIDQARRSFVVDSGDLVRRTRGKTTRTPIGEGASSDLRGLSSDPYTGLLYTFDGRTDELLALDADGTVVERYDSSELGIEDVQGVAVAPSADSTDDPATTSIFLADAGGIGSGGEIIETSLVQEPMLSALAATDGTLVRTVDTAAYDPPSPDPSGLAYMPGADRLFISDGEVDEMPIFEGSNLFATTRTGSVTALGVSQPWSDEPVGVGFNPVNNHLFVSDDDQKEVFDIAAGPDSRYGTSDDTVTHFDTAGFGNTDPEGLDYDTATNSLWLVDGVNREVFRVRPGSDGRFGTSDDVRNNFDVGVYGARDPEGLGYDAVRDTIVIVDDGSDTIYELDKSGALLNTINASSVGWQAAAGLAVAPHSTNPSMRSYYVVARGLDNDSHPTENDGKLYEITASLPPTGGGGNQAPLVSAGPDSSVILPASATLNGTVSDDGQPDPPGAVTTTWSEVSGPGDVTFGDASATSTTATFSAAGSYVLRLTAFDGVATSVDEVTVLVLEEGSPNTIERRVAASSDDAEQAVTGSTALTSSDLEITTDGSTQQVVGTRFTGLQIPQGATITNAWVQFRTDEVSTAAASVTIRAESSDNAPTYQAASGNVTGRAVTATGVPWTPAAWNTVGESGPAQQTPNIAAVVQAVVNRPGWASGNALALQFSGTGRRTAEAYEGGASFAPLLHVEFSTGGGGTPPTNQPPSVDAGLDATVTLPASAALEATVSDDGLPNPPGAVTTTWSKTSGPGDVTFGNISAVDTTASFSAAGSYVLRLTADDGELLRTDDVTISVEPEPGSGAIDKRVAAGSDDAEQAVSGFMGLNSSDLELTTDGNTQQVVGTRFTGLQIPQGATITNAWVQFRTDENSSGASSMTIRAEANDNAPTYQSVSGSMTARAVTAVNVPWTPPDWTVVGAETTAQRTPNVASLVQAVVNRPGWASGNALALQFSGTGRRTAEAYEGGASFAPLLHVEFNAGGGGGEPAPNQAPLLSAGPDTSVIMPASASLDGTVSDDGKPDPPGAVTTTWSKVSGPGDVTFGNISAIDTTASFSAAGNYVLRLTASDGELTSTDDVTVTAQAEGTTQSLQIPIRASADDAEERYNGSVLPNSTDLDVTADGKRFMTAVGLRFNGVDLPSGAVITNAYVQFAADEAGSGAASLTVKAQASDNAPAFTNSTGNLSARPTTTSAAAWSPPAWTAGAVGVDQRTSNLAAVLQEVINRGGWTQGNAVALLITGTADRTAESFEGAREPVLHIDWHL